MKNCPNVALFSLFDVDNIYVVICILIFFAFIRYNIKGCWFLASPPYSKILGMPLQVAILSQISKLNIFYNALIKNDFHFNSLYKEHKSNALYFITSELYTRYHLKRYNRG